VTSLRVARTGGLNSCLDVAVLSVLRSLVDIHLRDPGRTIELSRPSPRITACLFEIEKIEPRTGPVQGEDEAVIWGTGLADWAVKTVLFGEEPAEQVSKGPDIQASVLVSVPPVAKTGRVRVVVVMYTGERYKVPGGYTYVDEQAGAEDPTKGAVPVDKPTPMTHERPRSSEEEQAVPNEDETALDEGQTVPEEGQAVPDQEQAVPDEEKNVLRQTDGDGSTTGGSS